VSFLNEVKEMAAQSNNSNKFKLIQDKLSPKDFNEFLATLDDRAISCAVIAKVLKVRGILISENSLRLYRRSRDSK